SAQLVPKLFYSRSARAKLHSVPRPRLPLVLKEHKARFAHAERVTILELCDGQSVGVRWAAECPHRLKLARQADASAPTVPARCSGQPGHDTRPSADHVSRGPRRSVK